MGEYEVRIQVSGEMTMYFEAEDGQDLEEQIYDWYERKKQRAVLTLDNFEIDGWEYD